MFTFKTAFVAAALVTVCLLSCQEASARPVWFGPGSGPISPFPKYKGWAQLPRQTGGPSMIGGRRTGNPSQPYSGAYHCVPNVGLVGANGVCPD